MKYLIYSLFYASVLYGSAHFIVKIPFFENGDPAMILAFTALTFACWNAFCRENMEKNTDKDKGGE